MKEALPCVGAKELRTLGRERCTMFMLPDSEEVFFLVPDTWALGIR